MHKYEELLIRACKSPNSLGRLDRLYGKVYLGNEDEDHRKKMIVMILGELVDKYSPLPITTFLKRVQEYRSYDTIGNFNTSETEHHLYIFRDVFANMHRERFRELGITLPVKWRR